ncbi:UNVERIFIED_CONTAM: hypothetical protein PYX00_005236 [Menopon gallinae]|uniref:Uncharacterized protein n=1 Tax=Menopon gallinae TaxID=328185 RepID=A0AAW2HQL8_9NEOP
MEKEVKHRLKRNRRRERAERMQAQRDHGDSAEDETLTGVKPPRPPIRRKKLKEPTFEEDIIDGFAILAFRSYEELEQFDLLTELFGGPPGCSPGCCH